MSSYWLKASLTEGVMVKWLMKRGIAAFERQWNYDASYVHELIETDPRAAWMFQRATSLGKYRKDVPWTCWRPQLSRPCDMKTAVRARNSASRWPSGLASIRRCCEQC